MDIGLEKTQRYLEWLKNMLFYDWKAHNSNSPSIRFVKRGQVYRCNFGMGVGSEQQKERPCVILQHYDGNRNSPNTIVAPITHASGPSDIVVPIDTQIDSSGNVILEGYALLGNIVTVSKARLGDYITNIPNSKMKEIDKALAKSIDVLHYYESLTNQYNSKMEYIKILQKKRDELTNQIKDIGDLLGEHDFEKIKLKIKELTKNI